MRHANTDADDTNVTSFLAYVALAFTVLVGYVGFVIYPSLALSAGVGAGLILLAAAAGVASFFSPCSVALLVSMLGRPTSERVEAGERSQPVRTSLMFSTALSELLKSTRSTRSKQARPRLNVGADGSCWSSASGSLR